MDKKGQVTMFVIIGLTLVLVAVLLFTMTTITKFDQPPEEIATHDFSSIIATYQAAAESCVREESKVVLKEIMSHGGYIRPEESFIALPDRTSGSAVTLSETSQELIPYWIRHLGSSSCATTCPVTTHVPPLEKDGSGKSIEYQVERELEQDIVTCLNSIELSHDYQFRALDEPKITMTTGEDSITYHLERPLEITYTVTDAKTTISTVVIKEPLRLKTLYELGVSIAEYAEIINSSQFLSGATKQVIQTFSLTSDAEIPPIVGETAFSLSPGKTWFLPTVEEELSLLLADNIPLIQIKGSADERLFLDPNYYSQALYNSNYFSPDLPLPYFELLPTYSFDFFYNPSWGVDLNIHPSNGVIIQPEGGVFSPIPFFRFGIQDYSFSYNLIFPVVIIIQDQEAFNGEGLTLLYAVETGLRNSESIQYADIAELGEGDTDLDLFSRDEFRMDGLVTIETIDAVTTGPLEDVGLFYACGDSTTSAGISSLIDGRALSYTNLPQCVGGFISGQLEDYFAIAERVDIIGDEDKEVTLELAPYKEFDLKVRTHLYSKSTDGFVDYWELDNRTDGGFLGPDDQVIYVFTRRALPGEEDYIVADTFNYSSENTVTLVPGTYDVEAHLIRDLEEDHIIPADEICYDEEPLNPFNDDTCEEVPAIEFNTSMYLGGLGLTADGFTLSIDNYDNDTLTVHIAEINLDDLTTHDDLDVLGDINTITENYVVLGVKIS